VLAEGPQLRLVNAEDLRSWCRRRVAIDEQSRTRRLRPADEGRGRGVAERS